MTWCIAITPTDVIVHSETKHDHLRVTRHWFFVLARFKLSVTLLMYTGLPVVLKFYSFGQNFLIRPRNRRRSPSSSSL